MVFGLFNKKTKEEKASVVQKSYSFSSSNEKNAAKVNAAPDFKGNKISSDSSTYYSYPVARGPNDETGDTLLIKCVKYKPPTEETEMGLEDFTVTEGVAGDKSKNIASKPATVVTDGREAKDGLVAKNFGMTADARTRQNQDIQYYIELPIPQDINDTQSVTWGEDTINMFELAGLAVAKKFVNSPADALGGGLDIAQAAFGAGITIPGLNPSTQEAFKAAIGGKAISALGSNVSPKSIISRATGQVLNSNLELLFQGVNLRSFPFSVTFSPRSATEGVIVREIIRSLKKSMSAKAGEDSYNGASASGIMIASPDVFLLEYRSRGSTHPFLNSFKTCALAGLSVNYTNSGTYATYKNSTPVNIRLDMTFKELNPIYAEDYDTPNAGPGVGY